MATSVVLLLLGAMLQAVGAISEVDVLGSCNSTLGTSYVLKVPDSCGNLTLVNHGILNNQTENIAVRLFLLRDRPELESDPGVNFTTSYILSTSPESCALGSAFRLYPGTTVSVSGCYSATGDDETDTEFYIIKDLQNFTDSYCNWDSHSLQAYPLSACGEESSVQMESSTTLGEEADYYFAIHNGGGSSRNAFTRTQIELALNITGYTVSESDVLDSCEAHTNQSCSIMINVHQSYFALVKIDPPENGVDQWQQYVETEILCTCCQTGGDTVEVGVETVQSEDTIHPSQTGGLTVQVELETVQSEDTIHPTQTERLTVQRTQTGEDTVQPSPTPPGVDTVQPGEDTLPPWVYGVLGGGVLVCVILMFIPVAIVSRRKCKPKRRQEPHDRREVVAPNVVLRNPPPSYNELFSKGGRPRGESNARRSDLEQLVADQTANPSSEATPGPAPEPSNCGNEQLLVGSPRDFAAAILLGDGI